MARTDLQLPLCLQYWSGASLGSTRFHQPATNFAGRKTLRTPVLDAEVAVKPTQVKPARPRGCAHFCRNPWEFLK